MLNKKGMSLTIETIVVGVIVIFLAVIAINLLINSSDDTTSATGSITDSVCEDRGGTCKESCGNSERKIVSCSGGKSCCV